MNKCFLLPLILILVLLPGYCFAGNSLRTSPEPDVYTGPSYKVENLEAYLHGPDTVMVTGKIRNTGQNETKGYVVVYFADSNDRVLESREAVVNDNLFMAPGQSGDFELSATIEAHGKIKRTYVEYVERDKKIKAVVKPLLGNRLKK